MARARNIKPSFFQNEELGELDPLARLLFIGMWTLADFKGCLEYRPKRLKVQLLPYDNCDIEALAKNLECSGVISIYSVQGQSYIKVINFEKHQNPHKNERESGTNIPDISDRDGLASEKACENKDIENIEKNREKVGTAPADSLLLIPDSPNPIADSSASSPPTAPTPRETPGVSQPLPKNWRPSPETLGMLAQHNIPETFIWDLVPEFELYWRERGTPALTWGNKFLKHAISKWREFQASPPATPAQRLPENWNPSREAVEALMATGIDEIFIGSLIPEFVIFWRESNRAHNSWNSKFMNHVKHQWENRQVPGQKSTRDLSLDEQLNDRTWAGVIEGEVIRDR